MKKNLKKRIKQRKDINIIKIHENKNVKKKV